MSEQQYRILEFSAENFKRLRMVAFRPKGRVTKLTGKNDQGKSSVLDAVLYVFGGAKAAPEMPMRKGAAKMEVKLDLGTLVARRTGTRLEVTPAKGEKAWDTPQAMLDSIYDELAFNPQEFALMDAEDQAEALRKLTGVDEELRRLDAANDADYKARTPINLEIKRLGNEIAQMVVQDGLPAGKVDEIEIRQRIDAANEANRNLVGAMKEKVRLTTAKDAVAQAVRDNAQLIENKMAEIARINRKIDDLKRDLLQEEKCLEAAVTERNSLTDEFVEARTALEATPSVETQDTGPLMDELDRARLINREIDKRSRQKELTSQMRAKQAEAQQLTRAMEDREEEKRQALANAKMPLEGLTIGDKQVLMNGIPVKQLGEARQILLGVSIGIARNPKLRLVLIPHGEALDEDALAELERMAEEKDFYVWMAKVDSSGKMGIYLEDGMIRENNEE